MRKILFLGVLIVIFIANSNLVNATTLKNPIAYIESPMWVDGGLSGVVDNHFEIDIDTSPNYLWDIELQWKCAGGIEYESKETTIDEEDYYTLEYHGMCNWTETNRIERPYDPNMDGNISDYPQRTSNPLSLKYLIGYTKDNFTFVQTIGYFDCLKKHHYFDQSGVMFRGQKHCRFNFTICEIQDPSTNYEPISCKSIETDTTANQMSSFGYIGAGSWIILFIIGGTFTAFRIIRKKS